MLIVNLKIYNKDGSQALGFWETNLLQLRHTHSRMQYVMLCFGPESTQCIFLKTVLLNKQGHMFIFTQQIEDDIINCNGF
jgi:hypothetical protein